MEALRSPGSFNEFAESLPREVSDERALMLYGVCLGLYRRKIIEQSEGTDEKLQTSQIDTSQSIEAGADLDHRGYRAFS